MITLRRPLASPRRARLVAPAMLASTALVLSGCAGGIGAGQAFVVGDTSYPMSKLNDVTSAICSAQKYAGQQSAPIPMSSLRAGVVSRLAMAAMIEQLAEEHEVRPTSGYTRQVSTLNSQAGFLPKSLREPVLYAQGRVALLNDLVSAVGEKVLLEEGVQDPTPDESQKRGAELLESFSDSHQVSLNPTLGMSFSKGAFDLTDNSASVAVSDFAKSQVDPEKIDTTVLEPALVCG